MGFMRWVGKVVAAPVRIANIPFRAIEKLVAASEGQDDIPKQDRIASVPLGVLGDTIEEAISGEEAE